MQITPEQIRLAEARGCRFQPATPGQVQIFSMQRRIFWLGTQALVALRGDGFFETAATLRQLLDTPGLEPLTAPLPVPAPIPAEPVAEAEPEPLPEPAPAEPIVAAEPEPEVPPPGPDADSVSVLEPAPALSPPVTVESDARPAQPELLVMTANLVSAVVSAHAVGLQELPDLIRNVHRSVANLTGQGRN